MDTEGKIMAEKIAKILIDKDILNVDDSKEMINSFLTEAVEYAKENQQDKTPIEIALGVDENGTTTARKLYEFLELNPAHYARWAKSNISENTFATENVDFTAFTIDGERNNPNKSTNYRLTASFAKKLAMTAQNKKGEEARRYFITVEDKLKDIAKNQSPKLKTKSERNILDRQIRFLNAKSRAARVLLFVANDKDTAKEHKEILKAKAVEMVSGENLLPMPKRAEKFYTATEVAEKLGISSANKVGRISNELNLKAPEGEENEFGFWIIGKSKSSSKEVKQWVYKEKGLAAIKEKIENETLVKS